MGHQTQDILAKIGQDEASLLSIIKELDIKDFRELILAATWPQFNTLFPLIMSKHKFFGLLAFSTMDIEVLQEAGQFFRQIQALDKTFKLNSGDEIIDIPMREHLLKASQAMDPNPIKEIANALLMDETIEPVLGSLVIGSNPQFLSSGSGVVSGIETGDAKRVKISCDTQ